jgi:hypothetical protein
MKIVTLNLYVFFVLTALVTGSLIMSQTTVISSTSVLDIQNAYSISNPADGYHVNTFVWPSPSSTSSSINADMSDVLTASFTNIIDTQIYTGLDRIAN